MQFILLAVVTLLLACSQLTAEQQIRQQLTTMVTAIESRQLAEFMDGIHLSFMGNKQINRSKLRGLLYFQLQRNKSISVYRWYADLVVSGEHASVSIKIIVTGSNKVLAERGRLYNIESNWIFSDGQWTVNSANWVMPEIINLQDILF